MSDSNTRERKPYEADGLVAAHSHMWLQRDPMWVRHSVSYVTQYPTWPVEWVQISVLLARLDYWNTGLADLGGAYMDLYANNTMLGDRDGTGLLNCSAQARGGCSGRPGRGHHIIDWDPPPSGHMFKNSEHTSVNNGFALRGLLDLADMAAVLGNPAKARKFKQDAAGLSAAMKAHMWDSNNSRYCDGICTEVSNQSGVTTSMFFLFNDLLGSDGEKQKAWQIAADYGLEGTGDYGAFIYLAGMNKFVGDDGTANLNALTKCDASSWCHEMEAYNATMTRETWNGGTYSHPWGTGAVSGIAGGILGIQQTSPTFATFTVKPRLGGPNGLEHASMRVPTLRGPIEVNATRTKTTVKVPCNTVAEQVCLYVGLESESKMEREPNPNSNLLLLDGIMVAGVRDGRHMCVKDLGCGADGARRVVEFH